MAMWECTGMAMPRAMSDAFPRYDPCDTGTARSAMWQSMSCKLLSQVQGLGKYKYRSVRSRTVGDKAATGTTPAHHMASNLTHKNRAAGCSWTTKYNNQHKEKSPWEFN